MTVVISKTRADSNRFVEECFNIISDDNEKNIIYCGVAGNQFGKIGDYSGPLPDLPQLYYHHKLQTLDYDPQWNPTFTADITKPETLQSNLHNKFDIAVITQVIEHVKDLTKIPETLYLLLKMGGHAIVDCPWGPEAPDYHAEPPSFGDYWRISDEGLRLIFSNKVGFNAIKSVRTSANAGILIQKIPMEK